MQAAIFFEADLKVRKEAMLKGIKSEEKKQILKFWFYLGTRFCSFSPCIEQSQRVCRQLALFGFQDINTMEILQTEYQVRTRTIPVMDFGFLNNLVSVSFSFKNRGRSLPLRFHFTPLKHFAISIFKN